MKEVLDFLKSIISMRIIVSIIVVIIFLIIYKVISYALSEKNKYLKNLTSNKSKTYFKMMKSFIRYVFFIITLLIVLQINGINVGSMLAGVGIVSIIIGFAIQDLLKDIIKGIDIISDQYFQIGDVIKYKDIEGKVLSLGLKCTKIMDVRSNNLVSISNRNIDQVEVASNLINIDVPMPYELKLEKAEAIIGEILDSVKNLEGVDKCEYRGVNKLDESSINYQIKVYCKPILKVQMNRDVLRCILVIFEKNKISVPYKQIDIHNK